MPTDDTITLDLNDLGELFKPPTANPFSVRPLDALGQSGMERVTARVLKRWPRRADVSRIVVRLPPEKITRDSTQQARDALRRYSAAQVEAQHIARAAAMRVVRYQTRIALITLAVTLVGFVWAFRAPEAVLPEIVRGFVFAAALFTFAIAGWDAATWLLFSWIPFVRDARLYGYVGTLDVIVEAR